MQKVWLRRLGIASLVAVALGWVPYQLYGLGPGSLSAPRGERDQLHEANLKLHERTSAYAPSSKRSATDDGELSRAAVERAARDELGLVKPGEVVYQVGEPGGATR